MEMIKLCQYYYYSNMVIDCFMLEKLVSSDMNYELHPKPIEKSRNTSIELCNEPYI